MTEEPWCTEVPPYAPGLTVSAYSWCLMQIIHRLASPWGRLTERDETLKLILGDPNAKYDNR